MNELLRILSEVRPEASFSDSHDFLEDGLLDSFDIVMLVAALDKTFRISIEGTEIIPENFRNVDAIRALLRKHGVET
jgi:acyl carrier protein